jgi:rSAM/selenodomain-associated transferase 2
MDRQTPLPGGFKGGRQDRAAGPGRSLKQAELRLAETYQVITAIVGRPQDYLAMSAFQRFFGLHHHGSREIRSIAAPEHDRAKTGFETVGAGPGHALAQILPVLGKEINPRRGQGLEKAPSLRRAEGQGQPHLRHPAHFFQDIQQKAVIQLCCTLGGQRRAEAGFHLPRARFLGKYDKQGGHVVSASILKKKADSLALFPRPDISIIIPVLNEAPMLGEALANLPRSPEVEIILVDGGSIDNTQAVAARFPFIRLVTAPRGRGSQMNVGARLARGELFVFLHIDTGLTPVHLAALRQAARDPEVRAGAFYLRLTPPTPFLRIVAWGANWRCRLFGLPYGDQVIFVRRTLFFTLGGYAHHRPEDLDLVLRLRRLTRLRLLTPPVSTSSRRWREQGNLKTTGGHWFFLACHLAERLLTSRWPAQGELRVGGGAKDLS